VATPDLILEPLQFHKRLIHEPKTRTRNAPRRIAFHSPVKNPDPMVTGKKSGSVTSLLCRAYGAPTAGPRHAGQVGQAESRPLISQPFRAGLTFSGRPSGPRCSARIYPLRFGHTYGWSGLPWKPGRLTG